MTLRFAVLAIGMAVLTACSSPPGPVPATPAPTIPADALAYDDLVSTNREFPFTNTCEQLSPETLTELDALQVETIEGFGGPSGCAVLFGTPDLDQVWIEQQTPPNPSEPRYFPLLWNGETGLATYHRRLLLDGRYYAVETIDFYGYAPGCYLTVDTGSPSALQFRGILPEEYAQRYGELNSVNTGYEINRAGIDQFMAENCPAIERIAIGLLNDIDPGGGSLATS